MAEENNDDLVKQALDLLKHLKKEIKDAQAGEVDISDVINSVKGDLEKLNTAAEEVYERTGMSKEEILNYVKDPDNFSKDEWEVLEKVKQETDSCKDEILKSINKESISDIVKQSKKKKTKKKKKRWLPS